MNASAHRSLCGDDFFGPVVKSSACRGGFDFTIFFEELILATLPAAIFIPVALYQASALFRRTTAVRCNSVFNLKLFAIGVYIALELALLTISATSPSRRTISVTSSSLSFVSGLALALLSYLEHKKSLRPSFSINIYLIAIVLLDIVRVRTRWLDHNNAAAGVLTASLAVTCAMLVLESLDKRSSFISGGQPSLESTSGLFSRSMFWWLNPLLLSGFNNVLSFDDLPSIHEKLGSRALGGKLRASWDSCNQKRKHALVYACIQSLSWDIGAIVVPKFACVGLSLSQAYLIKTAIEFVQNDSKTPSHLNHGYGLIGAFALVFFGFAVMSGWAAHLTIRLNTMMRGELVDIIYNKMLQLPEDKESAAMTLMGTEVQRIAETFHFALIEVAPSAAQLAIAAVLLYLQLGVVFVAPLIFMFVATGLSMLLAKEINPKQEAYVQAVKKRLKYASEVLGSMKNVKMLGLTSYMLSSMQSLREQEMQAIQKYNLIQALNVALSNVPGIFNSLLIFAAYAIVAMLRGQEGLTVSQAITSLSLLSLIYGPLSELISAIPLGWSALGCFVRIQAFLQLDAKLDGRCFTRSNGPHKEPSPENLGHDIELQSFSRSRKEFHVKIEDGNFGWSPSTSDAIHNANIAIPSNARLTLVIGPIGSGKSTLLKGILGETITSQGRVAVPSAQIAYCEQTPWIMNSSIRDNILLYSEYKQDWYDEVVIACALEADFQMLPQGDSTIVGSKGMKLSGGQRQRVALARALYSHKEFAVCDDVLSGLDSTTASIVFGRVFSEGGLFRRMGTTVILATHAVKFLSQADFVIALDEQGQIIGQGQPTKIHVPADYLVKLESKSQELENTNALESGNNTTEAAATSTERKQAGAKTDHTRKKGNWNTYKYYIQAVGIWRISCFFLLVATNSAFNALQSVWLNWWASNNEKGGEQRLGYWLGMFSFISIVNGLALASAVAFLWVYATPKAGKNLHQSMVETVTNAPYSVFTATDTGVLVNRFSQDLRLADSAIPGNLVATAFQFGACIADMALAITAVSYFAAVLPLIAALLYYIQRFYLATSRQLRLLEIEAQAPLFSNFIESLSGLTAIRSYGLTSTYIDKNRQLLDSSQKPFYLLLCIQRWLVLVLDLVVACLVVLLVGMTVALRDKLNAGFLGIALVHMMTLSQSLAGMVESWTSLETSMGAVARIRDFVHETASEVSPGERDPDPAWPTQGAVKFEGVSASYERGGLAVLQDVTLSVEPGQKVAIVGRTGSGKSSTALTLMRMTEVIAGRIILDGVDLFTLRGSTVREKIICLPQDPFLFPGSIRANTDPLGNCSDEDIRTALQKVGIWKTLEKKAGGGAEGTSGLLDTLMDAEFLSHGQRQLLCLGRAMLKSGKVLLLDEPTSSVDEETDAEMQRIISTEFANHTVIMITHNLSSILNFDVVMVLDSGCVVEIGRPRELKEASSYFTRLYNSS